MRCAIRNFSNLSWSVAYLKLSDETWNEMCYLKLLKLFKPIIEGCLFKTFIWDLKWDVLFETCETYVMEGCLFETFRWDLKWNVLLESFETFQTYHGGLLYLKLSDETWNEMCY